MIASCSQLSQKEVIDGSCSELSQRVGDGELSLAVPESQRWRAVLSLARGSVMASYFELSQRVSDGELF